MKKVLVSVIAIVMAFSMFACSDESGPEDAVKSSIEEFKTVMSEEVETIIGVNEEVMDNDACKAFIEKASEFEYEITDVEENGDTATVGVKITTYDFGDAYTDMLTDLMTEYSENPTMSQDDIYVFVFEGLSAPTEMTYEGEVEVTCTKEDGEWTADLENDQDFLNTLFGGMVEAASNALGTGTDE